MFLDCAIRHLAASARHSCQMVLHLEHSTTQLSSLCLPFLDLSLQSLHELSVPFETLASVVALVDNSASFRKQFLILYPLPFQSLGKLTNVLLMLLKLRFQTLRFKRIASDLTALALLFYFLHQFLLIHLPASLITLQPYPQCNPLLLQLPPQPLNIQLVVN